MELCFILILLQYKGQKNIKYQKKYKNIFKGAYERLEKYISKNKTQKVNKNYL